MTGSRESRPAPLPPPTGAADTADRALSAARPRIEISRSPDERRIDGAGSSALHKSLSATAALKSPRADYSAPDPAAHRTSPRESHVLVRPVDVRRILRLRRRRSTMLPLLRTPQPTA